MKKSLVEYLNYLRFTSQQVSLVEFRTYCAAYSLMTVQDGTDYGLFECDERYIVAVIAETSDGRESPEFTGSGRADVLYVQDFDDRAQAKRTLLDQVILDNDLDTSAPGVQVFNHD